MDKSFWEWEHNNNALVILRTYMHDSSGLHISYVSLERQAHDTAHNNKWPRLNCASTRLIIVATVHSFWTNELLTAACAFLSFWAILVYWCTPFCFTANLTKCNNFLDFSYASFQKGDHSPSTHEVKNCSKGKVGRQTKMAKLLLQKQSHPYMNWFFFLFSYILRTARCFEKKQKKH